MTYSESELLMHLHNLSSSLQRLAAPATDQIKYLESIGPVGCADELALEFDDYLHLVWVLEGHALLGPEQKRALFLVDEQLKKMSGQSNDELWSFDALIKSLEWGQVRKLAFAALSTFSDRGQFRGKK